MHRDSNQDVAVRERIERQRRLACSEDIFEQVVDTLYQAGVLGKRLQN